MIETEVSVTLSMNEEDETGQYKRSFYVLNLERKKITYLPTIWTIVHPIDDKSPLYNLSNEEIEKLEKLRKEARDKNVKIKLLH